MRLAADPDPESYRHFNDFFVRALAPGQRPIDSAEHSIIAPADGCISQLGRIRQGRVFQAKGREYNLLELVGGDENLARPFIDGLFATIYLSPKDYHRVHMPLTGVLRTMVHVPGDLFSVNTTTAIHIPKLFARNERVVCHFDTAAGPMVVILVGAMIVASIETVWAGLVTPVKRQVRVWSYGREDKAIRLEKGAELGRFTLGSTVIVLLGKDRAQWHTELRAQSPITMGSVLGTLRNSHEITSGFLGVHASTQQGD